MKSVARNAALAAAGLLFAGTAGCASNPPATTTDAGPRSDQGVVDTAAGACKDVGAKYPSLKGKKLNIGSSPGLNYYDFVDEKDPSKVIGLEPDLIGAVAKCVGFDFAYQKQSFDGLVPAIASGRIDLITSGMYATPERAKQVNFVTYMKAAEAAVVQAGNPKKITSLETMCGATVAQVVGTVEVELAAGQNKKCTAAGKPAMKFINFTNNNQLTSALTGKRADVFLTDAGVAAYLAKQFQGKLEKGFDIVSDFRFGIGVNKAQEDLFKAIHESLTAMEAAGELQKIAQEWGFNPEAVIKPEQVTG